MTIRLTLCERDALIYAYLHSTNKEVHFYVAQNNNTQLCLTRQRNNRAIKCLGKCCSGQGQDCNAKVSTLPSSREKAALQTSVS